jgi:hypothetical protein
MGIQERQQYVKKIKDQNIQLNKTFSTVPVTKGTKSLRWRISSDIDQTQWRTNYLSEM